MSTKVRNSASDPSLRQVKQRPTSDIHVNVDVEPDRLTRRRHRIPASVISAGLHASLLVILALIYQNTQTQPAESRILQFEEPDPSSIEPLEELSVPDRMQPTENLALSLNSLSELSTETPSETIDIASADEVVDATVSVELSDFGRNSAANRDLLAEVGAAVGADLKGRSSEMRGEMVAKYGGTPGSERAVVLALRWFADHQRQDGSWTFEFRDGPCRGKCDQSGRLDACPTGATAMALLPFLGAGNTHLEGEFKNNVHRGLRYLLRVQDRRSGSLASGGGNLYAHGLAAIALCESYAMTRDQMLKGPAQAAINFTVFAQDPRGGGWRYIPKQPGDTSAVGWQLMALKSAHMGHLSVPSRTVALVDKYLNSVQAEGGATYGYTNRNPRPGTSAVGLLCRMYLGWEKDHPGIQRGVEQLMAIGPAADERVKYHMYYNYYATQVLRHYGGDAWITWNETLRDHLVAVQERAGHQAGSWTIPGWESAAHDASSGGRLYYTSLATMILEVYYRHMPIYSEDAADEFPL